MIPAVAAGLFGKYVRPDASPILEAGAGTGLMGSVLDAMGYRDQVGIDISAGMLEMASKRHIYKAGKSNRSVVIRSKWVAASPVAVKHVKADGLRHFCSV